MTRISYCKSPNNPNIEFSNLMMTKDAVVIFIEINFESSMVAIKDIEEGQPLIEFIFESEEEAKKKARTEIINLGVDINQEIREKGD